jgi:hypothetical protein
VTWYGRWHAEIEGVHIWLASGRWIDAVTGQGGRLGRRTVQQLLQQCWAREKPLGRWCATLWWAAGSFFELFDSLFDVFAWLLQSLQP